ncbi:hypothetical protein TNCV_1158961 [Trichonephila clavipes]|nr:hypothetical protein TNCV_1158961 [Trichonephila clavipes]
MYRIYDEISHYYLKYTAGHINNVKKDQRLHIEIYLADNMLYKDRTFKTTAMVVDYPVGIWLIASAEYMGGSWTPTPQRCSAGYSLTPLAQCVLVGCSSKL